MSQAGAISAGAGGSGNVAGPVSSIDRAIATWNGVTGTALFDNSTTKIDSTGRMTNSAQPSFRVFLSVNTATNLTGDGTTVTVPFDTVSFDQGTNYSTVTNTYTFPIAGVYQLTTSVFPFRVAGANTVIILFFFINGASSNRIYEMNYENIQTAGELILTGSYLYKAAASDTVQVQCAVGGAGKNIGFGGGTLLNSFSGFLVC